MMLWNGFLVKKLSWFLVPVLEGALDLITDYIFIVYQCHSYITYIKPLIGIENSAGFSHEGLDNSSKNSASVPSELPS